MSDSEVDQRPTGEPDSIGGPEPVDGLISRLAVIDGQPLGDRAAAFAQIHDQLRSTLEDSTGR